MLEPSIYCMSSSESGTLNVNFDKTSLFCVGIIPLLIWGEHNHFRNVCSQQHNCVLVLLIVPMSTGYSIVQSEHGSDESWHSFSHHKFLVYLHTDIPHYCVHEMGYPLISILYNHKIRIVNHYMHVSECLFLFLNHIRS